MNNSISVIMPTYNAEKYVGEAIESVLKQSFDDFEFIIVDDSSTDSTLKIINSYDDKRIKLIQNEHNFIGSLNIGLDASNSKYVARMDADDIMHVDRLKVQYAIMEEEPNITVCSSWMTSFGQKSDNEPLLQMQFGLLELPLLSLLKGNIIFHPTVMMRTAFLRNHNLKYENYEWAEDYKLWTEIAKKNGIFYIDSQPLLNYRVSEEQISVRKKKIKKETSMKIKFEIVNYLIAKNEDKFPSCRKLLKSMLETKDDSLMTDVSIFDFFFMLFFVNKTRLAIN